MTPLSTRAGSPERLPFLDVLRGVAALVVVVEHGLAVCFPGYLDVSIRYFDMGQYGVTLFLLISGFIIPTTIERGGSNARFWVNRFFRLFPLYWATIAFFALYYALAAPATIYPPKAWHWLANLTMLQEFLQAPHVTQVFWTLTLELIFYAACSLLFALGLFRWTAAVAWLGLAGLLCLGVAYPLLAHRRFPGGYAFLILTMFVGTLFHRCTTGQLSRRHMVGFLAALVCIAVPTSYVCFTLFPRSGYPLTYHCVLCVWLGAYLTFAASLRWRERTMPAGLGYLGRISYSIYLTHTCLVLVIPHDWSAAHYLGTLLGGTIALSSLTFYAIERPFLMLGRRLLGKNPSTLAVGEPVLTAPARAA